MKVYLAGPMTGLTFDEARQQRRRARCYLAEHGHQVRSPMRGELKGTGVIGADGNGSYAPPRAIFNRDIADVRWCEVVLLDLTGAQQISIGSMKEQSWAAALNKYIVLVDPLFGRGSVHDHLFTECEASIVFADLDDALDYLVDIYAEDER